MVTLSPQLVHDAVRLLHHDLHLVVFVRHGLHLPHRVHQVLLQLLVRSAQVGPVVLRMLGCHTGADSKTRMLGWKHSMAWRLLLKIPGRCIHVHALLSANCRLSTFQYYPYL